LIAKGATPKGNIEDLNNIFISLAKNINSIGENETTWFDKLIEYGADINAKDKEGKTALDYSKYHKEVKDFLISRGAKPAGNSDMASAAADGN
jgi:ankyrin repeat protein